MAIGSVEFHPGYNPNRLVAGNTRSGEERPPEDAIRESATSRSSGLNPDASSRSVTGTSTSEQPDGDQRQGESDDRRREGISSSDIKSFTEVTPEEQTELNRLKKRDREVRAHEQAHMASGGQYVRGGASYEFQTGPDGRKYAVGGEVSIDTSQESDPAATLQKAQTIRRAALAPAQPSSQDRKVAAQASQMMAEARSELTKERQTDSTAQGAESEKESGASVEKGSDPADPENQSALEPGAKEGEPVFGRPSAKAPITAPERYQVGYEPGRSPETMVRPITAQRLSTVDIQV